MEELTLNRVGLGEMAERLAEWESRKLDLIVPSKQITCNEGLISMTSRPGVYIPAGVMLSQISDKLKIPKRYFDYMRSEDMMLFDTNVNTWLNHEKFRDSNFMLRLFESRDSDQHGVGRAFLSDRYKTIDNLPVLFAVLEAIKNNNLNLQVDTCSISESKMYVRFFCPDIVVERDDAMRNYRNPDSGVTDNRIAAGLAMSNSEVGKGAFWLAPWAKWLVCSNGWTMTKFTKRKTHVGAQLEEGDITWSEDTIKKNLSLVQSQVKDYVNAYVNRDFLNARLDEYAEKADQPVLYPMEVTVGMGNEFGMNDEQKAEVLQYFIKSGDMTAGGITQAFTYYAHEQESPDLQTELESKVDFMLDSIKQFDKKSK